MFAQMQTAIAIPDKLFFKIGEVCEIVGVQAHVLRYWETEFPMLQPQKNRAGQRTYRRKDVEMALRIKALLYDERFTIAGAKRRLQTEGRSGHGRLKVVSSGAPSEDQAQAELPLGASPHGSNNSPSAGMQRHLPADAVRRLRVIAEELLTTLKRDV